MVYDKKMLALLVLALLVASVSVPAAYAQPRNSNVQVNAVVTVKAAQPTVSFKLYSDSGYTTPTKEITPQTPVYMKIDVSGDNPLNESVITVQLFADNNSNAVGTPPASTSPETYVKFTISYDEAQGEWVLQADTGGSTTWNIKLDPNQQTPDPTAASGSFYVIITFGKTAREASTSDSAPYKDWDIIVTDTVGTGNLAATGQASDYGYTVYFYSETTTTASTISFGTIQPDTSTVIQAVDGNPANTFTVKVIANGYYNMSAAGTDWVNSTNHYTIHLVAGTPGNSQLSILIDDNQSNTNPGEPAQGVYVNPNALNAQPFLEKAQPTTESGVTINIYMKLTLGSDIHTGQYQGTITIFTTNYK